MFLYTNYLFHMTKERFHLFYNQISLQQYMKPITLVIHIDLTIETY
jgi:hypothetical protein